MKKVAIVQRALVQYRKEFHNQLREKLKENNVELTLIYSKYQGADSHKKDQIDLPWATVVPSKMIGLGPVKLLWQSCLPHLRDKDLIIVEQANKNLLNYILFFNKLTSKQKLAYWGHGINRQINKSDIRNKFKKTFQNTADWWFAYTQKVKEYLVETGYPVQQITTVQNAIDTRFLLNGYQQTTEEEIESVKKELNINSDNIGIYCGGIYKEKRVPFLIQSCLRIKEQIKDFHFIVIGSGPDSYLFEEAANEHPWIHYIGPKFEKDKIKYFKSSKVFLMPGLVGLAILDSFALQTPILTTEYPFHSPEIEYLQNGINGIISEDAPSAYADQVIRVFTDEHLRMKLVEGCKQSSIKYTVENMVSNFADGILKCLHS